MENSGVLNSIRARASHTKRWTLKPISFLMVAVSLALLTSCVVVPLNRTYYEPNSADGGDCDFVIHVLKAANEKLEEKYALEAKGYDFDRTVQRVAQVLDMQPDEVTAGGKSPQTVLARALLCFWAQRKLGMTTIEIARRLAICQSAVSRLSRKGEELQVDVGLG